MYAVAPYLSNIMQIKIQEVPCGLAKWEVKILLEEKKKVFVEEIVSTNVHVYPSQANLRFARLNSSKMYANMGHELTW